MAPFLQEQFYWSIEPRGDRTFYSEQFIAVTWSVSSTSIGYACCAHRYVIVCNYCWKFYPKSLVEIVTAGVGTAFGKTEI